MIHRRIDKASVKGWLAGPWDSDVPVAVGYATAGVDEPHRHERMFEVYCVAGGSARALVAGRQVTVASGDMLVVKPGEEHTFTWSSADYMHFVIQAPFVAGDKSLAIDKT